MLLWTRRSRKRLCFHHQEICSFPRKNSCSEFGVAKGEDGRIGYEIKIFAPVCMNHQTSAGVSAWISSWMITSLLFGFQSRNLAAAGNSIPSTDRKAFVAGDPVPVDHRQGRYSFLDTYTSVEETGNLLHYVEKEHQPSTSAQTTCDHI